MSYFTNFPLVVYDFERANLLNQRNSKVVSNILVRAKLVDGIFDSPFVYYKYDVVDGDTPESLAFKYYGSSTKHWAILIANNITDPFYDWPLKYENFVSFVESKYGSIATAKTTTHHYEKIITKTDSVTSTITVNKYELDYNTYANLASSTTETINLKDGNTVTVVTTKNAISYYDYEDQVNESKRSIKILDNSFLASMENQLDALITNG